MSLSRKARRVVWAAMTGAVIAAVAAACGSGSYDDDDSAATTQAPASTADTNAAVVKVADVAKVGKVLVNSAGLTLYTFNQDVANSGKSTCTGSCVSTWPPLSAPEGALAKPEGLVAELGVITRDDGKKQLTYAGKPLYLFAGDKAPGDANGQGLNGVWFAAPVQPAAAGPTPDATGGGAYGY